MIVEALLAGLYQVLQMALVLVLAPGLTGLVRVIKARLLGRRGPPLIQPYRDLIRLLKKDVVLAENASWLFRVTPISFLRRSGSRRCCCRPSPRRWR
jgi:formate hydrogenlyase subunit 4